MAARLPAREENPADQVFASPPPDARARRPLNLSQTATQKSDRTSFEQQVRGFAVCLCCEAALPTTPPGRWRGRVWRYRDRGPETRMSGAEAESVIRAVT